VFSAILLFLLIYFLIRFLITGEELWTNFCHVVTIHPSQTSIPSPIHTIQAKRKYTYHVSPLSEHGLTLNLFYQHLNTEKNATRTLYKAV